MKIPSELKYSKEHEWVKVEGNKAFIGVTDYAQNALGNIVFVELPEKDAEMNVEDVLGAVESVKAASDINSPVSGTVVNINEELIDVPEKINSDPYGSWIAAVELSNASELDSLLDAGEYEKFCEEE